MSKGFTAHLILSGTPAIGSINVIEIFNEKYCVNNLRLMISYMEKGMFG